MTIIFPKYSCNFRPLKLINCLNHLKSIVLCFIRIIHFKPKCNFTIVNCRTQNRFLIKTINMKTQYIL